MTQINSKWTHAGMNRQMSCATFSQFFFVGQNTRHDLSGTTSRTSAARWSTSKLFCSAVYCHTHTQHHWYSSFTAWTAINMTNKWMNECRDEWWLTSVVNPTLVSVPTIRPPCFGLPFQLWSTLNQFQTDNVTVLLIRTNGELHRRKNADVVTATNDESHHGITPVDQTC